MQTVITILWAVLVFGILILIHEVGHFTTAKLFRFKVNEFAMGMGPKLFSKVKGDTAYSIRLFPIGGFVAMEGEDGGSEDVNAFNQKPIWQRAIVLFAGSFMNLLLGVIIFTILTAQAPGNISSTTIAKFHEGAVSSSSLLPGDKILSINGSKVNIDMDIIYSLMRAQNGVVSMTVLREGEKISLNEVTFKTRSVDDNNAVIKIDFMVKPIEKTALTTLNRGFFWSVSAGKLVISSLVDLVTGKFTFNQLSGPVGVTTAIGEAAGVSMDALLMLVGLITINLGLFNLLPLPALDGGRLLFLVIEAVRRRPINPKYESYIHFAGFALLILLMIAVTFNDIIKLI